MSPDKPEKQEEKAATALVEDIYGDLNVVAQTVAAGRASIETRFGKTY